MNTLDKLADIDSDIAIFRCAVNRDAGSISDAQVANYCADDKRPGWMHLVTVRLAKILIWEGPVDRLRPFYPNGKTKGSGFLKQGFIVISPVSDVSIIIEKDRKNVKCSILQGPMIEQESHAVLNRISRGTRVSVERLMRMFNEEAQEYSLLRKNCWKCAHRITKRVIVHCAEASNLESTIKESLRKDLELLEAVKRFEPSVLVLPGVFVLIVLLVCFLAWTRSLVDRAPAVLQCWNQVRLLLMATLQIFWTQAPEMFQLS